MENNNQNTGPKMVDDIFKDHLVNVEIPANGGEWIQDENCEGANGMTMYDLPNSQDNLLTVLVPKSNIRSIAANSIVRIGTRTAENGGDGREYMGIVVEGPFHVPDGIRADSSIMISTTINGGTFMPNYHGRVFVELIGELVDDVMMPPRFRPLPNSPVFVLGKEETAKVLNVEGDITFGLAIGHDDIKVQFPSDKKSVLPRHFGILGTTGSGKSTSVSGLIAQFQQKGIATIVIDTEGEYTQVDCPTEDKDMQKLLAKRGILINGITNMRVFHPVGRDTRAEAPTPITPFTLKFSSLSPYAAADILGLNEAQFGRFFKAYEAAKLILKDLGIFPKKGKESQAIEIDEFESGWPDVTLSLLIDVAGMILCKLTSNEHKPFNQFIKDKLDVVQRRINAVVTDSETSWLALLSKLWQLRRAKVFDTYDAMYIPFSDLIKPGQLSIIDLSDSDSTIVNNIIIANLLRGIQQVQEDAYEEAIKKEQKPTPVSVIIEEAHEFLSREKISKMSNLFEQVARIARRGRKRWLGLVFVTQLPQHLPDEVLGLINSYILHKINDSSVISRLKRSIGGVDVGMWNKLPNLAPGQAVVTTPKLTRPLLVAMDPSPCKLLMVD